MFLSYNAKLSHLHQDNLTHRKKYIRGAIRKTLDNIMQDDITKVCQEVLKPVAELTHKTKDQECFYDNFYGKRKLVNINSQELNQRSIKPIDKYIKSQKKSIKTIDSTELIEGIVDQSNQIQNSSNAKGTKFNKKKKRDPNTYQKQIPPKKESRKIILDTTLVAATTWLSLQSSISAGAILEKPSLGSSVGKVIPGVLSSPFRSKLHSVTV